MVEASATPGSRLERRKARTRRQLVDAARTMLAENTAQQASIHNITDAADVGFGSFYNHFTSKTELFDAAVADVLEETGKMLDELSSEFDDPAAAYAQSVRLASRLAVARPEVARILVRHGLSFVDSDRGLAPRALRDITAGIEAGRFTSTNPRLALAGTAGSLFVTMHLLLNDPTLDVDATCDELAEQLLRMLGVPADDAHTLATAPLPDPPAASP